MPDDAPQQPKPQGTVLHVREQDTKTSYANVCLLSSTREELILNFGLTLPSTQRERREANMLLSDRIIMSLPAAKRLAIALSQAVQRYENAFGVIELGQQTQPPPADADADAEVPPPPSR